MKLLFIFILIVTTYTASAQESPAEQFARKIAMRMKDSLALTIVQCDSVYHINMRIHRQKMAKRQQYGNDPIVTSHIQQVENTRDSLYHTVLPEDKYLLYKSKKRNIVHNNN